jgi:dethiobiotin synthetase
MRGLFVTGTDTDVGKTILSAALLTAMAAAGVPVRAYKPVVTGLDEAPGEWPPDHELLAVAAGMDPEELAPLRYSPAVSPHLAAALAGEHIELAQLLAGARAIAAADGDRDLTGATPTLVVEGVGGLLTPLTDERTVCDFAGALGLPVLIAARPGLGTINHTLLTLEVARAAGLDVRAVVLTPMPQQPSAMERSNRDTIAHLGEIEVVGLPYVAYPHRGELAQAGAGLPWRRWL